jgi:hypothetical protein
MFACAVVALLLAPNDVQAQFGYDFKHLRSFSGANGLGPEAALIEGSDGNSYGTDRQGGTIADGCIFRLTGKLEFKAGDTRASIKITPKGDLDGAVSKVVKIQLLPGSGYKIATPTTIKLRIIGK